ncbi:MAG TPA: hypothetical protein VMH77_08675 [Steroidobacteraceae bacterium]|nr:hypothetical protein [Steroidobacteraceae bacterium]
MYLAGIACLVLGACADFRPPEFAAVSAADRYYGPPSLFMGSRYSSVETWTFRNSPSLNTDAHAYMDEPEINIQRLIAPQRF